MPEQQCLKRLVPAHQRTAPRKGHGVKDDLRGLVENHVRPWSTGSNMREFAVVPAGSGTTPSAHASSLASNSMSLAAAAGTFAAQQFFPTGIK